MPEFKSPVYSVIAVPIEKIQANTYNPNHVAPPEMKLLYQSIKEDGYTMPIVCYYLEDEDKYEIVDGYHRYTVMLTHKDIYEREHGMLPVSVIDKPVEQRMASTIRHNRARGEHSIELMSNIVAELVESGMSDAWIMKNIGMDAEELLRLKQLTAFSNCLRIKTSAEAGHRYIKQFSYTYGPGQLGSGPNINHAYKPKRREVNMLTREERNSRQRAYRAAHRDEINERRKAIRHGRIRPRTMIRIRPLMNATSRDKMDQLIELLCNMMELYDGDLDAKTRLVLAQKIEAEWQEIIEGISDERMNFPEAIA